MVRSSWELYPVPMFCMGLLRLCTIEIININTVCVQRSTQCFLEYIFCELFTAQLLAQTVQHRRAAESMS